MNSDYYIPIVLCADKNVVVGLHVALYSVLSATNRFIKIYILHKGYDIYDKERIFYTLSCFDGSYEVHFFEVNDAIFENCRGLYGNTYAFVRLLISHYVNEPRVIYMDTDVIFNIDIDQLYRQDLDGFIIGASMVVNVSESIERGFFKSLGFSESSAYFNSGIMLIDLDEWRRRHITDKCIAFIEKYGDVIRVADETVLNVVFHNDFKKLDKIFNYPVIPTLNQIESKNLCVVFHFMQSPKPWDLFGEFLHGNYAMFEYFLKKTYFSDYKSYKNITIPVMKHSFRLLKAYKRCISATVMRTVTSKQGSCRVQGGVE